MRRARDRGVSLTGQGGLFKTLNEAGIEIVLDEEMRAWIARRGGVCGVPRTRLQGVGCLWRAVSHVARFEPVGNGAESQGRSPTPVMQK